MAITVKMDLSGMDALIRDLGVKGRGEITRVMAETVLEAANETVPVQSGALQRSGRIEPRRDGSTAVMYGSSDVKYAVVVHQSMGSRGFPMAAQLLRWDRRRP